MRRSDFEFSAIVELAPGALFRVNGGDGITWQEGLDSNGNRTFVSPDIIWYSPDLPIPSKEDIKLRADQLESAWQFLEYQRLRKTEYPPLADLADAIYWQSQGDDSKMTAYLAAVQAVKDQYPKGDE